MTTLCEQLEAAQAWSIIDNKPVSCYLPRYDAHIVYWNGVAMTRTYALLIISTCWTQMYHTQSVKEAAWGEYNRVYRLGAFGHQNWDKILSTVSFHSFVGFLTNLVFKNVIGGKSSLVERYTPQEAFMWLDPEYERVIEE